jgi:hypothetical protein
MQTASPWNPAPAPAPGPTPTRVRPSRRKLIAVGAVATIGAVVALFGDASPTSWWLADAVWRALFVAVCALAGSRARRWTLVWGGVVATAAGGTWFLVAGAAALAGAVALFVFQVRDRVAGAAIGAGIALGSLHLVRPWITGLTAAVAAIAVVPMLWSGHRRSRRHTRRTTVRVLVGVAVVAGFAVAATGLFGLDQRDDIQRAVEETRRAVDAVGSDDPDEASRLFRSAAAQFASVRDAADAPWLFPARVLPVLGSNLGMLRTAADVGADLNIAADELTGSIDQESLRHPDGGIDLAVLAALDQPVGRAVEQISVSQQDLTGWDSPWLLQPVRSGYEDLAAELERAEASAGIAEMAVDRAPYLLGADGPRRYLMLLGNPAESRDLGGHLGNWAELTVENGNFSLSEVGQPYDLTGPWEPLSMTPGAYPQSLVEMRPQSFPQNWGSTPDFPTVARLAAELFPQVRPGPPLDGVAYADPAGFAALLNFTGPAKVPGTDLELTPQNAERFLTVDQFSGEYGEDELVNDAVNDLIEDVVRQFSRSRLPSPRRLTEVLGPLVEQGRLQFASLDPEDEQFLDEVGLLGQVERPGAGDLLWVVTRNTNPSKIDVYLERRVEYSASWDPESGALHSRVRVTLENTAARSGLPFLMANTVEGLAPGTNRTTLSVLSPANVRSVRVDGEPAGIGTQQELRGVRRHSLLVDIPPGESRVVEIELAGTIGVGPYVLQWIGQPAVNPGSADVIIRSSGRRSSGDVRRFAFDGAVDELVTVRPDEV